MPNAYGFQFRSSPVPAIWDLFFRVSIGAAGAPTIVTANGASKSLVSIVRNGAGLYTLTLDKKYPLVLGCPVTFIAAAGAASPNVSIAADNVAAAGTLQIVCEDDNAATDPANGEIMLINVILKNSTVF